METEANSAFLSSRSAELAAGRQRFQDRHGSGEEARTRLKNTDAAVAEDMDRRNEVLSAESIYSRADKDRAGAEIGDQAQTMLEGVKHLADRDEKTLTVVQNNTVELLKGNADPVAAQAMTVDLVTAQAVNQPTILASDKGLDTEKGEQFARGVPVPPNKFVPKTRPRAEYIAKEKVPSAKRVVKENNADEALRAVEAAIDEALG